MAVLSDDANGAGPRLPLVGRDQAPLAVRALFPAGEDPSNITRALAGSPDTLALLAPLLGHAMNATTVDLATKEVVVLRVSALNRCDYCVPTHEVAARRAGLPDEAVAALAGPGPAEAGLTEAQRALARFCDQVVSRCGAVDDAALAEMRAHFEEHEIVELTVLAGLITMLNYVAGLGRLPLDPRTVAAR